MFKLNNQPLVEGETDGGQAEADGGGWLTRGASGGSGAKLAISLLPVAGLENEEEQSSSLVDGEEKKSQVVHPIRWRRWIRGCMGMS